MFHFLNEETNGSILVHTNIYLHLFDLNALSGEQTIEIKKKIT